MTSPFGAPFSPSKPPTVGPFAGGGGSRPTANVAESPFARAPTDIKFPPRDEVEYTAFNKALDAAVIANTSDDFDGDAATALADKYHEAARAKKQAEIAASAAEQVKQALMIIKEAASHGEYRAQMAIHNDIYEDPIDQQSMIVSFIETLKNKKIRVSEQNKTSADYSEHTTPYLFEWGRQSAAAAAMTPAAATASLKPLPSPFNTNLNSFGTPFPTYSGPLAS